MTKKQNVFSPQFRQQMSELQATGRSLNDLAREFGCGSSTIAAWVKQSKLKPAGAISSAQINQAEREELTVLRKRVKQLEVERDILSKGEP